MLQIVDDGLNPEAWNATVPPEPPLSMDRRPTHRMPLPAKAMRIGRDPDNDLTLHDLNVSRYHAELRKSPTGSYEIVDLGSHNGIFVNGKRVLQAMLTDHDVIRIGDSTFRLAEGELWQFADDKDVIGAGWGTVMTEQAVRVERSGPVSTVFLHRPARRNAVDGPTAAELAAAFRAFDADSDSAVAVLHGEGGVFCSGADLTAIGTERGNRAAPDGDGPMGVSRLRLSKPVIAAVSGYAVAGGLELALWCDLRVADETAIFGVFCRRWGVPLIDGGTVRLPRLIGTSRAMDMILTGRAVDAQEAAAIGLANRVVPAGQALSAAQQLAAELAGFPQVCLRSDRASVLDQEGLDETAALASEFAHGRAALTAEAASGAARFAAGAGRHGSFGAR
jgi:enoyl-CoA hydratase